MNAITVRELGGEIWAEIQENIVQGEGYPTLNKLSVETIHELIDLTMGVIARHAGKVVVNDPDLPVTALKRKAKQ